MQAEQRSFPATLRSTFLRGVGVIIPLVLTYWVFSSLLDWMDGILLPILTGVIGRKIPGLGFASMLVLIMLVGLLARNLAGRLLLAGFEDVGAHDTFCAFGVRGHQGPDGIVRHGRQGTHVPEGDPHGVSASGEFTSSGS